MAGRGTSEQRPESVMVFGVGAFTQGVMAALGRAGARTSAYLTRPYGHYGPSLEGKVYDHARYPTPRIPLERERPGLVVPMSIEWALAPWMREFLGSGIPILCPTGEGLLLERDRDVARRLCRRYGIPFPAAFTAPDRAAAKRWVRRRRLPFVIKNPLCSPFSPVHTIVCESMDETLSWLDRVDDREGVFLQAYLGRAEVGHIALVSDGEIYSLATNQEYKRAFDGNLGIVAGAPLGGLVEVDPGDRYGLARDLIRPLRPWFRRVGYRGPVQVTAIRHRDRWQVLEYNVRLGVTSGPLLLHMLDNPLEVLRDTVRNRPLEVRFKPGLRYGCSLTRAGYGYPYVQLEGPLVPIVVHGAFSCAVWWGEVAPRAGGGLDATGHRVADVAAWSRTLDRALATVYANMKRIHCLGSYYRLDVGRSLWPPGRA